MNLVANKINQVNYVLAAVVDDSYMAATSFAWKEFGTMAAGPVLDGQTVSVVGNVSVPLLDFGMQPDANAVRMWSSVTDNIAVRLPDGPYTK